MDENKCPKCGAVDFICKDGIYKGESSCNLHGGFGVAMCGDCWKKHEKECTSLKQVDMMNWWKPIAGIVDDAEFEKEYKKLEVK